MILLIASIGVMFALQGIVRFIIGPDDRRLADGARFIVKASEFKAATGLKEGLAIKLSQGLTVVVAAIAVAALFWFLHRTRAGKAMRAYSDNEDLALLSGVSPDRVVLYAWLIAATLAAVAGTMYGIDKSYKPFTYFQLLLPIFASAILGGIGHPIGAVAGGFIVALSETAVTYAYKKFLRYLVPESWGAERSDAAAVDRLQARDLLRHPGGRSPRASDRDLPRAGAVMRTRIHPPWLRTPRLRTPLLFAGLAVLLIAVGVGQSWVVSLSILNLCLISAIMALGLNMQWGYAGLLNVGVMGFAALGGLAGVLVSQSPVGEAWAAGGAGLGIALAVVVGAAVLIVLLRRFERRKPLRTAGTAIVLVAGFFIARIFFDPAVDEIERIDSSTTGYLGGAGLPIILSWAVGGLLAAGAAWLIGKVALGLRSDYFAIATLGIAEIVITVIKNEDWLGRGVKNVTGLDRPVPYEIDLQQSPWFLDLVQWLGADPDRGLQHLCEALLRGAVSPWS